MAQAQTMQKQAGSANPNQEMQQTGGSSKPLWNKAWFWIVILVLIAAGVGIYFWMY